MLFIWRRWSKYKTELKIYCCLLKLSSEPQIRYFNVDVLQRTARNCSKVRAARAARVYLPVPPIKFPGLPKMRYIYIERVYQQILHGFHALHYLYVFHVPLFEVLVVSNSISLKELRASEKFACAFLWGACPYDFDWFKKCECIRKISFAKNRSRTDKTEP